MSASAEDVRQWLANDAKLERYFKHFMDAGYDALAKCCSLNENDLDKMGIELPGHRKRLIGVSRKLQERLNECQKEVVEDVAPTLPPKKTKTTSVQEGPAVTHLTPHYSEVKVEEAAWSEQTPPKVMVRGSSLRNSATPKLSVRPQSPLVTDSASSVSPFADDPPPLPPKDSNASAVLTSSGSASDLLPPPLPPKQSPATSPVIERKIEDLFSQPVQVAPASPSQSVKPKPAPRQNVAKKSIQPVPTPRPRPQSASPSSAAVTAESMGESGRHRRHSEEHILAPSSTALNPYIELEQSYPNTVQERPALPKRTCNIPQSSSSVQNDVQLVQPSPMTSDVFTSSVDNLSNLQMPPELPKRTSSVSQPPNFENEIQPMMQPSPTRGDVFPGNTDNQSMLRKPPELPMRSCSIPQPSSVENEVQLMMSFAMRDDISTGSPDNRSMLQTPPELPKRLCSIPQPSSIESEVQPVKQSSSMRDDVIAGSADSQLLLPVRPELPKRSIPDLHSDVRNDFQPVIPPDVFIGNGDNLSELRRPPELPKRSCNNQPLLSVQDEVSPLRQLIKTPDVFVNSTDNRPVSSSFSDHVSNSSGSVDDVERPYAVLGQLLHGIQPPSRDASMSPPKASEFLDDSHTPTVGGHQQSSNPYEVSDNTNMYWAVSDTRPVPLLPDSSNSVGDGIYEFAQAAQQPQGSFVDNTRTKVQRQQQQQYEQIESRPTPDGHRRQVQHQQSSASSVSYCSLVCMCLSGV